jgi:hypothetical protein
LKLKELFLSPEELFLENGIDFSRQFRFFRDGDWIGALRVNRLV